MKNFLQKFGLEKILIILLIIISLFYLKSCLDIDSEKKNLSTAIKNYEQKPKVYKDDSGHLHSVVVENLLDKTSLELLYKHQIDSITKLLRIKEKQVNSFLSAGILTSNTGFGQLDDSDVIVYTTLHDTTIQKVLDSSESNLNVNDGHLVFNAKIFKDKTFKWNYNYKDSLNVVSYSKKTGFLGLGKTENYVDVSMSNKNSTIQGIQQFKIKEKTKRFSVGPYVGYSFNGFPSIGIGVQFSLFKF